jgi:hypothetical protein
VANVYLASSWRNEQQPDVIASLRADGHTVYDFRNLGFTPNWQLGLSLPVSVQDFLDALEHPHAVEAFRADMNALKACDVCLLLLPSGASARGKACWAVGAGKLVIALYYGLREPELMLKMIPHHTTSLDYARQLIRDFDPVPA